MCPTAFDYKLVADNDSMYNTPPTYAIYIAGLVLKWIDAQGGVTAMEAHNRTKAAVLYDHLDSTSFYQCPVAREDRSLMNVPFRLPDEKLDEPFLKGAQARGLVQLKGHRSVGGMRASIYNAMPIDGVRALVGYMKEFEAREWLEGGAFGIQVLTTSRPSGLTRLAGRALHRSARRSPPRWRSCYARPTCTRQTIAPTVQAIARAGAGTNNIPVEQMSARGVPVFNAPGANANAVKELVLAGMLIAARHIAPALRFVDALDARRATWTQRRRGRQEGVRRHRTGRPHARRDRPGQDRLPGRRRRDQARHARARLRPGDHGRRGLEPAVAGKRAASVNEVLKAPHFVTLHVPLVEATRDLVNAPTSG